MLRTSFFFASVALHAVVLVAAAHARASSSGAQSPPSLVDVAYLDLPPSSSPIQEAPPVALLPSFVSRPTHTHSYPVPADHDARPHDASLVHLPLPLPTASAETAPNVVAEPAAPERFTLTIRDHGNALASTALGSGTVTYSEPGSDDAPLLETGVSSPARLTGPMTPRYPERARAEEVEADVALGIVVSTNGAVLEARITKSAGFGFDEAALDAVRAARFLPAQRGGRSVAVRMQWTVSFRLR